MSENRKQYGGVRGLLQDLGVKHVGQMTDPKFPGIFVDFYELQNPKEKGSVDAPRTFMVFNGFLVLPVLFLSFGSAAISIPDVQPWLMHRVLRNVLEIFGPAMPVGLDQLEQAAAEAERRALEERAAQIEPGERLAKAEIIKTGEELVHKEHLDAGTIFSSECPVCRRDPTRTVHFGAEGMTAGPSTADPAGPVPPDRTLEPSADR